VKWRAVAWLEKRTIRVPVTAGAKEALLRFLAECDGHSAGTAAMVLANCVAVPPSERVPPIMARFVSEVQTPAAPHETWGGSYISPYVRRLNAFLRAFSFAGDGAIPYLARAADQADDPYVRKWLAVARGMAGDPEVAAELERIIREDPDTSTRIEATRGYARSAKEAAIPLLVELLDDPAEIAPPKVSADIPPSMPAWRPVMRVAQAALSRLGRDDLWRSHPRWADRGQPASSN
jgi:hypothetical protein